MANWENIKSEVIADLNKANINPQSNAGKHILKYERAVNSLKNRLSNGMTWNGLFEGGYTDYAWSLLLELNNEGIPFGDNTPKYFKEWVAYCKAAKYVTMFNLGDALC